MPTLTGHRLIASWPLRDGYLGIMRPLRGKGAVIVTFDGVGLTWPLAKLAFALESISIVPPMHDSEWTLNLAGRDNRNTLVRLQLGIPHGSIDP